MIRLDGTARYYAAPYNERLGIAIMRQYPSDAPQAIAFIVLEREEAEAAAHNLVMYFRRVEDGK